MLRNHGHIFKLSMFNNEVSQDVTKEIKMVTQSICCAAFRTRPSLFLEPWRRLLPRLRCVCVYERVTYVCDRQSLAICKAPNSYETLTLFTSNQMESSIEMRCHLVHYCARGNRMRTRRTAELSFVLLTDVLNENVDELER